MAERSTARPADGAAQRDDDPSDIDSWVSQLSGASDSDSDSEWPEAATPQRYDDVSEPYGKSYRPEDTSQEHEARHARHQQDQDEYEQYDGAYDDQTDAYQQPGQVTYPEPARYEPDQTYQYDQHEHASGEERTDHAPYGHIDPASAQEDAYSALQDTYVLPEVSYPHEGQHPSDHYASPNGHRYGEPDVQELEAAPDGRDRPVHNGELDARPRQAGRRRWLIAVGGLGLGLMLCASAVKWVSGQPPESEVPLSIATNPPDTSEQPLTLPQIPSAAPSSAAPHNSSPPPSATRSAAPSAKPSGTPSITPSATPSPTRPVATPTQTRSSSPLLLGPSSGDGVANMVQGYCDRRVPGSSAKPRNDGGWQCTRLLVASAVDMDVACRDTYGSDAYAGTSDRGDPYAWRCYR